MAVTGGQGHTCFHKNRRFEDYRSMKQYFSDRTITEIVIDGSTTTGGALAEISFVSGDFIDYIAAEGQVYIRTEADDANQDSKYVYIEYQDDTGAIRPILTADLAAPDNTVETIVTGASDFYRLRQMISEVESASGGGNMVILTDANYGGADDGYGYISDSQSSFSLERFFTQPAATCISYLGYIHAHSTPVAIGAGTDTYLISVTFTPKVLSTSEGFAEPQVAADKTLTWIFQDQFHEDLCIELEPATEVIFKIGDAATANVVHIQSTLLEVYPTNSTPSS